MSIELPPLPPYKPRRYTFDGCEYVDHEVFEEWKVETDRRERILLARIAELHKDLADCYRLTGADPDGNEDWRLARDAVKEVAAMRTDLDLAEARIAEQERQLEQRRILAEISDTDLRLARGQRDWAYKEIKTLRIQLREAGLLEEGDDVDGF